LAQAEQNMSMRALKLQPPVVDVARNFFLDRLLDGSQFYYIPQICNDLSPANDHVFTPAVETLALAAFSNERSDPAVLDRAYASYARTLQKLQTSLDQESLEKTLASVLLLSHFEALLPCSDADAIFQCWVQHIKGAYALFQKHQDELNLESPLLRALFAQTLHALNLYYTDTNEKKPKFLLDMSHKLLESGSKASGFRDQMRLQLHVTTDSLNDLRRDTEREHPYEPFYALQKSLRVEREILALQKFFASNADFRVYSGEEANDRRGFENATLYRGSYHVYKTAQDIRLWNNVRLLRVTVLEKRQALLRYLRSSEVGDKDMLDEINLTEQHDSPFEQIWDDTRAAMIEIVDEVCASVVQVLRPGSSDCSVAAASQLVWPLYICGRVAPDRCLKFVEDRLDWMARTLKIHSAKLAIERGREPVYQDDFMHVCHTF
jgi:hypothetical protein